MSLQEENEVAGERIRSAKAYMIKQGLAEERARSIILNAFALLRSQQQMPGNVVGHCTFLEWCIALKCAAGMMADRLEDYERTREL